MSARTTRCPSCRVALAAALFLAAQASAAVQIAWTDWTGSSATGGFTATGTMTTPSTVIDVTYNNPRGVGFIQTGSPGDIDYFQNNRSGRNPATSPYTSDVVDNIPTGTDIIALQFAGQQTLSFSVEVANPVFAFVSLNGNGYAFDQDFEVLSIGNAADGNDCGYWGCGSVSKQVVEVSPGVFEYRLIGSGEPHGTLRFTGSFSSVSWRSLTNEFWNGFTVGVEGTSAEVFGVPEPHPAALLLAGLAMVIGGARWRRR